LAGFDLLTIYIFYIITSGICLLFVLSLWYQDHRRSPGMDYWLAYYALQVFGILMIVLRLYGVPEWLSLLLGNPPAALGHLLYLIGLELYLGKRSPQRHNWVLFGVYLCIHTYFSLVQPSLYLRGLALSVFLSLIFSQVIWLMFRGVAPEVRPATRLLGVVYLASLAVTLVRLAADLASPPGNDLWHGASVNIALVLETYGFLLVANTIALVLMVNRLLLIDSERDVQQRKQSEEALRASEERYRVLFRDSPDAYLIFQDGVFVECNGAVEAMLRSDRGYVIGKTPAEISPEYQPDGQLSTEAAAKIVRITNETGAASSEWIHRRADGTDLIVEVSTAIMTLDQRPSLFVAWRDITERKLLEKDLQFQATTDTLTGVWNRRRFWDLAQRELRRARRTGHPLAAILIDLDRFKNINDTYGHGVGDRALVHFTQVCSENLRDTDVVARFGSSQAAQASKEVMARLGGDEFALLLPETSSEQALRVVERLGQKLSAEPLQVDGLTIPLTFSAGISELGPVDETLDDLLARVDRAMYRSKSAGRNQTHVEAPLSRL
jgi:PAS domain S-box-containing protein